MICLWNGFMLSNIKHHRLNTCINSRPYLAQLVVLPETSRLHLLEMDMHLHRKAHTDCELLWVRDVKKQWGHGPTWYFKNVLIIILFLFDWWQLISSKYKPEQLLLYAHQHVTCAVRTSKPSSSLQACGQCTVEGKYSDGQTGLMTLKARFLSRNHDRNTHQKCTSLRFVRHFPLKNIMTVIFKHNNCSTTQKQKVNGASVHFLYDVKTHLWITCGGLDAEGRNRHIIYLEHLNSGISQTMEEQLFRYSP